MYTAEEYTEMLFAYAEAGRSASEAVRLYAARFPDRLHPHKNVFLRLVNRARTDGSLMPNRKEIGGRDRHARTVEMEEAVINSIEQNPTWSIREVASTENVSKSTVQRIFKTYNKHAYHYTKVQCLRPEDYPLRMQFCTWLLEQNEADPQFLEKILFTDESLFSRQGIFNAHNFHYYGEENPHVWFQTHFQQRFSKNLWAGILGDHVIGPFEFQESLTGERYLNFLQNEFNDLLDDVPLQTLANHYFQHDGAPPHFALEVRAHLNELYGHRWIGRGGPIHWPARSPDLTPMDFFYWGYLKSKIYSTEVHNLDDLQDRIELAIGMVTPEMLQNSRRSLLRRAQLCLQAGGGHFEHLL